MLGEKPDDLEVLVAVLKLVAIRRNNGRIAAVAIAAPRLGPVTSDPQSIQHGILLASGATSENGAVTPLRDVQRWAVVVVRWALRPATAAGLDPLAA